MDNEKVFYHKGEGTATEVRILLFNDAINIYDTVTDSFIKSYPLKGTTYAKNGEDVTVFAVSSGTEYLQIPASHSLADLILKEITNANHGFFKKVARQKLLWFAAIIIAIIIGVYLLVMTLVPYIGALLISSEVEVKMGNQLKEVMLAEEVAAGSSVDSVGTLKLQTFADKIKLSNTYPIRVTLVNSNIVNAYALPGGQIVVYSGMLKNITEPEELVALLAHEALHVNRRHSLRSMLRSAADALVISILFNDVSAITATILGNTQTLRGLDYSRSAEKEADEYGMKLMLENNVDMSGMKKLMEILEKQGGVPENISFLSSHPLTTKRIEAAENFIRKHPQKTVADNDLQLLFRRLKQ
jgi:beta-barrel assembly-enhancing protease